MKLDSWCLISRSYPALPPPEQEHCCLHGLVSGHPRCHDGKEVTTSFIVSRDGSKVVTKSGSEYELGDVDASYEALYPNARTRLLAGLSSLLQSVVCYADGTVEFYHDDGGLFAGHCILIFMDANYRFTDADLPG